MEDLLAIQKVKKIEIKINEYIQQEDDDLEDDPNHKRKNKNKKN